MKTTVLILLGLFCLSFGRVAQSDGPYWCKESQRKVKTCPTEKTRHFIISEDLAKPVVGECEICKDPSISSYYNARNCPKDMKKCVASGSPICAVTSTGHMVDFTDECSACGSDFKITQYFRSQCPRKKDPTRAYCGPLPRKELMMCAMMYSPVCGTDVFGNKRTLGNACSACGAGDIAYHTKGSCEGDDIIVRPRPLPVIEPMPIPIDPILVDPIPVEPITIDPVLIDPMPIRPIEEPHILPMPIEEYPVLKPALEPVVEPPVYVEPEPLVLEEPHIVVCYMAPPDLPVLKPIEEPIRDYAAPLEHSEEYPVDTPIEVEPAILLPAVEETLVHILPAEPEPVLHPVDPLPIFKTPKQPLIYVAEPQPAVMEPVTLEPHVSTVEAKPAIHKAVLDQPIILTVEPESNPAMLQEPAIKTTLLRRQAIA